MKNWWKTSSIEEKLDIISWLEKAEWNGDICHNVIVTHSSIHTVCDNADRIKESVESEMDVFV